MIWSAFAELCQNLSDFDKEIAYKQKIWEFYRNAPNFHLFGVASSYVSDLRRMYQNDRVFEYNSLIISLYGYVELFVESLLKEYLAESKKQIDNYEALSSKTKEHYRKEMLAMFNRRKTPKLAHLTDAVLAANMYETFHKSEPNLLPEMFFQSGGNYNFEEITNSFCSLGLNYIKSELSLYPPLHSYYINQGYTGATLPQEKNSKLYEQLDDLVCRRNEIAHGANTGNMLDVKQIKKYKVFVYLFCSTLCCYLSDKLNEHVWNTSTYSAKVKQTFNHSIARISGEYIVFKGSPVLVKSESTRPQYWENRIEEIFVNDAPVNDYLSESGSTDKVTVKMKVAVKRKSELRFL
jgi:hypothetical protein